LAVDSPISQVCGLASSIRAELLRSSTGKAEFAYPRYLLSQETRALGFRPRLLANTTISKRERTLEQLEHFENRPEQHTQW
jgi:hypothetical protein